MFCIGANKTGTTSVEKLFNLMGLKVGKQVKAERLIEDWAKGNFDPIVSYVRYNGVAFQDIPFSLPNTFKAMDQAFPKSKFILTVRNTPEDWYRSLVSFHSKVFGNGSVPSATDLKNSEYVYKGWIYDTLKHMYKTPDDDIYHKETLIKHYNDYNESVVDYFKDRPDKLLVVNVSESDAAFKISSFLGSKTPFEKMPWENKT